jgi:hypothetical protein
MKDANDRNHLNVPADDSPGIVAGPNTTGSPAGGAAIPDGEIINGIGGVGTPYSAQQGDPQTEALGVGSTSSLGATGSGAIGRQLLADGTPTQTNAPGREISTMQPTPEVDRGAIAAGTAGGASAGANDGGIANGGSSFEREETGGGEVTEGLGGGYAGSGTVDSTSAGATGDPSDNFNLAGATTGPGPVQGGGGYTQSQVDPTLKHMADDLPRQGNAGMPGGFLGHDSDEEEDAENVTIANVGSRGG